MPAAHDTLEIDDLIVLLLGAPSRHLDLDGQLRGITKLEKLLFLVEHELEPDWFPPSGSFIAHHFGPFSRDVYDGIDQLASYGLLEDSLRVDSTNTDDSWESRHVIGASSSIDPYQTRDLQLTELGWEYYRALEREVPTSAIRDLGKLKDRFGALPLRQLIRYVYKKYPRFTENSVIRDKVLGN